jgi:glycerophosphoryl diester phosphodiesterase
VPEEKSKKKPGILRKIILLIIFLIFANVILQFFFVGITERKSVYPVSHRGAAAVAPENTMSAVMSGVSAGAPFVEIDVRLTADRVFILMHDSTVDRTTDGEGPVRELEWDYIKGLDAGGWYAWAFKGEQVPTLDTVLAYMKGKPSTLVIEVKDPGDRPGTGEALGSLLRMYGMEQKVVVVSFDGEWVEDFGLLSPETTLGILYIYPFFTPPSEEVEYVSAFWPAFFLDPSLVWRMRRAGHTVWAWNVSIPFVAEFLTWKGVEGIVADNPGLLKR